METYATSLTHNDGRGDGSGFVTPGETVTIAATYGTTNDVNGNPRRVWVGYNDRGAIVAARDVGYGNPPSWHHDARTNLPTVYVTPSEYREWLDRIEDATGQFGITDPTDADHYVWARFSTADRARRAINGTGRRGYRWHRPMTVCRVTYATDATDATGA